MILEGVVNQPSNISFSDGDDVHLLAGKSAELMVSGMHGNLYTLTYRGMLFHGYNTTATAIPITSTTTPTMILWNPYGSGVNCILVHYAVGYAAGTNVEGNVQLAVIQNAGASVATGAPISVFTNGPTINGNIGSGMVSKVKFGTAATVVAVTKFLPMGISLMQMQANNASPAYMVYDFAGTVIVPEGTAVFDVASAATSATHHRRLSWYEYPK